jgi:hypothetical protein
MRGGRPVLGAISGLLFGIFLALDLQQFAIRPLDSFSVIGLPAIGLVVGLALGLTHPLRRGTAKAVADSTPSN